MELVKCNQQLSEETTNKIKSHAEYNYIIIVYCVELTIYLWPLVPWDRANGGGFAIVTTVQWSIDQTTGVLCQVILHDITR